MFYWAGGRLIAEERYAGSTATAPSRTLVFSYDESGQAIGFQTKTTAGWIYYYYVRNLQGDVVSLYRLDGADTLAFVANYKYDPWGRILSVTDANGSPITNPANAALINPLRYRGYYYDSESGFYYLQSRYYDPAIGRFINADSYGSTGQGFLGYNMFAYCGNTPVICADPTGQYLAPALFAGGCSAKPEPYKSPDEAAKAFLEQTYSSSSYIRHEYSTEIYSRTIKGETTYNFNPPRAGQPHSASVGKPTPKGTKMVAYAHTHPNSNSFSGRAPGAISGDIPAAKSLGIDAYVVGPNLELQRYSVASGEITNLGVISPIALTDAQRFSLVVVFQVSWDTHISAGCDFDCGNMTWPTR